MNTIHLIRAAAASLLLIAGSALAQDCQVAGGGVFEDLGAYDDGSGSCRDRARFSGSIVAAFDGVRCDSFNPEGEWELTLSDGRVFQADHFDYLTFRVDGIDIATAGGTGVFDGHAVEFVMQFEGEAGRRGSDVDFIVVVATYSEPPLLGNPAFDSRGWVQGGTASLVPD